MVTMEDLARRLFGAHRRTIALYNYVDVDLVESWDDLSHTQQEAWLTVAHEAIKVGVEIQQAAVREAHGIDTKEK